MARRKFTYVAALSSLALSVPTSILAAMGCAQNGTGETPGTAPTPSGSPSIASARPVGTLAVPAPFVAGDA
ncbi:MAG: hypothetical protein U0169_27300, partial [Polyangiaceae bacterium]